MNVRNATAFVSPSQRTLPLAPGQLTELARDAGASVRIPAFLLLAALLCFGAAPARAGVTSLRLRSETGSYFLGGKNLFFVPADGSFTGGQGSSNSVSISFHTPTFDHFVNLRFAAPQGQSLMIGSYPGAERFSSPVQPGLDIDGDGSGCNTSTGSFVIKQTSFGANGALDAFWATFEFHCEGTAPALFGEIRFNADVPVVLSVLASASVVEEASLSLAVRATDSAGRHVTLTASNVPPGATFVDHGDNTGALSWTPGAGQAGVYDVYFHGENDSGQSDDGSSRIAVTISGDDLGNASPIASVPFTRSLDTTAATSAGNDPFSCGFLGQTVWFVYSPTERARIEANTFGSDFDTGLAVFTGSAGSLAQVTCNDNAGGPASAVLFDALAGQTYYFLVGSTGGRPGGNLVFSVNRVVPPAHDDFGSATRITSLPYTDLVDTTGAIAANDDPRFCTQPDHTVWYVFTPTNRLRMEASTDGSDYETVISVLTGQRGALTQVACHYGPGNNQSSLTFDVQSNRTYYVLIGSADGARGGSLHFSLSAIAPSSNDDFDQATPIASLPYRDTLNTSLATASADDPTICNRLNATVWYSFIPTEDLFVEASTAGSDYSAMTTVYRGSRGALEPVACFGGDVSRFPVTAGIGYFFEVGSLFGGDGGHLNFTVHGRPRLKISVSVEADGSVNSKIGSATLQGTVTSSRPVTIYLSGALRQTAGRFHVISGTFGEEDSGPFNPSSVAISCPGQCQWSVRVLSPDGSFGGGYALAALEAFAAEDSEYASAQTDQTVHLSGSTRLSLEPSAPRLLSGKKSGDGTVLLQSLLVLGQTNIVEASSDLLNWTEVGAIVPASNPSESPDPGSLLQPRRFYRVLTLP